MRSRSPNRSRFFPGRVSTVPSVLFFAVASLWPACASWGWIDTGHKVIARITWEELTPAARAGVTAMLQAAPAV